MGSYNDYENDAAQQYTQENQLRPQQDEYDYSPFYDEKGNPIKPRSARRLLVGLSVVFFAMSLGLMVLMFVILHSHNKSYARCSADVMGVVVDNVIENSNDETNYYPVFRYEYRGRSYEKKSSIGKYLPQYKIGEKVTVHINPNDPDEYYTEKDDSTMVIALSVLSAALMALGIMLVIVCVKSKQNEKNQQ